MSEVTHKAYVGVDKNVGSYVFSFIVWSELEHVHKNSHSFINSWYFTAFSYTNKMLACRRFGEEDLLFLPLQLIMLVMAGD